MLPVIWKRHPSAKALVRNSSPVIRDFAAGLALIAIAIPEQIATARLAGAPPGTGLLVFMAGSLGFFLVGANRYLSVGADSTIAPLFAASLAGMAAVGGPRYVELAALLAILVGLITGLAGLIRLGWVSRLLSVPVITGFLAGVSVHIAVSQLPALMGLSGGHGPLIQILAALVRNAGQTQPLAIVIGVGVFAVIRACERIDPRLPGALIAIVLASILVATLGLAAKGVATLGSVTVSTLWPLKWDIAIVDVAALLPLALLISLIVIIQTVTVSQSFHPDGVSDIDRDLAGVGFANILSGLTGGFPANSSPPRSAIMQGSGAASPWAGLTGCAGVGLFVLFGLGFLAFVPEAALAGLLLFVAARIFRIDLMKTIWSESRSEFWLLLVTAAAIVVMPIATGVAVGVGLSLLHGVWTIAQTRTVNYERVPGTTVWWPKSTGVVGETQPGLLVVGFQAPLFFLNAGAFRKAMLSEISAASDPVRAVILEASSIGEIDFSGAQILSDLIVTCQKRGVMFFIARLESVRAQRNVEKFGILAVMGEGRAFQTVAEAVDHIARMPARTAGH